MHSDALAALTPPAGYLPPELLPYASPAIATFAALVALLSLIVSILSYRKARATFRRAGIVVHAFYTVVHQIKDGDTYRALKPDLDYIEVRVRSRGLADVEVREVALYKTRRDIRHEEHSFLLEMVEGPQTPFLLLAGSSQTLKLSVKEYRSNGNRTRIFTDQHGSRLTGRLQACLHLGTGEIVHIKPMPAAYLRWRRQYHLRRRLRRLRRSLADSIQESFGRKA